MDKLIDLISRKATIDSLLDKGMITAAIYVERIPTADVPERNVGLWEIHNILDYAQRPSGRKVAQCPFCKYLSNEFRSRVDYYRALTNFCPNCGARMVGKETKNEHTN